MPQTRTIGVELEDGAKLAVAVETTGGALVADQDILARVSTIAASVESVSRSMLDAVKRVSPKSATVELNFGLALEAGQLVALFGKAKGEASITVTLEWAGSEPEPGG
jgi:Trypsin-co-occurring domain 1